jgi:hypothetical protein
MSFQGAPEGTLGLGDLGDLTTFRNRLAAIELTGDNDNGITALQLLDLYFGNEYPPDTEGARQSLIEGLRNASLRGTAPVDVVREWAVVQTDPALHLQFLGHIANVHDMWGLDIPVFVLDDRIPVEEKMCAMSTQTDGPHALASAPTPSSGSELRPGRKTPSPGVSIFPD